MVAMVRITPGLLQVPAIAAGAIRLRPLSFIEGVALSSLINDFIIIFWDSAPGSYYPEWLYNRKLIFHQFLLSDCTGLDHPVSTLPASYRETWGTETTDGLAAVLTTIKYPNPTCVFHVTPPVISKG